MTRHFPDPHRSLFGWKWRSSSAEDDTRRAGGRSAYDAHSLLRLASRLRDVPVGVH